MPGPAWSAQEKDSLRQQLKRSNGRLAQIQIPGRTANAIRAQAVRMGLLPKGASRKAWSPEQRALLKKLHQQGYLPQEIFLRNLLGSPRRTKWSIVKQWGRLQLADRRRVNRGRRKKRWTSQERAEFETYLRRYSKTKTPEEIAQSWQVARSTVCRWQARLGVKQPREKVLQMPHSQAKQRRARQRMQQASQRAWRRRRREREKALRRLARELRRSERPPEERVCVDCGESWPKRREFFPYQDRRSSFGTSRYFKHRCLLCQNARRRKQSKK